MLSWIYSINFGIVHDYKNDLSHNVNDMQHQQNFVLRAEFLVIIK